MSPLPSVSLPENATCPIKCLFVFKSKCCSNGNDREDHNDTSMEEKNREIEGKTEDVAKKCCVIQ